MSVTTSRNMNVMGLDIFVNLSIFISLTVFVCIFFESIRLHVFESIRLHFFESIRLLLLIVIA